MNSLTAVPIRQIYERWVSRYEEFWANNLLHLEEDVEKGRPEARTEELIPYYDNYHRKLVSTD